MNEMFGPKDFPSEKPSYSLEWRGVTASNVAVNANLAVDKLGKALGTFRPTYFHRPWKTTFFSTINTDSDVSAGAIAQDLGLPNTTCLILTQHQSKENSVLGAVEFHNEYCSTAFSADIGKSAGSSLKANAVVGKQALAFGASVEYLLSSDRYCAGDRARSDAVGGLKESKYIVSQVKPDYELLGYLRNEHNSVNPVAEKRWLGLNFLHRASERVWAGIEMVADVGKLFTGSARPISMTMGAQYRLGSGTVVKGKLDTEGKAGLSVLAAKYNDDTSLLFSTTLDTTKLGSTDAATFGFSINLGDTDLRPS